MSDEIAVHSRSSILLTRLSLSQPQLAQWLRVSQTTVSRLVSGQDEHGSVSRLLDQLEFMIAQRGAAAAREWVLSGAISPEPPAPAPAAERPSHIMQAGFGNF